MPKVYQTADEIPADFKDDYEEKDGAWHFKMPDVTNLSKALASERTRAATEEAARKAAEKRATELERTAEAKAKGISEEELQKIRDAEATARRPIEEERDRYKAENRKLKLTDRVQALYLANGGMSDRIEDAMLVLERRSDLGDADGLVWKDKEGGVTTDTPDVFFRKLKTEKPWLFQGTGSSGSGAGGSNGRSGDVVPVVSQADVLERKRHAMPGGL